MLPATPKPQATKITGIVYMLFGFFALFIGSFVLVVGSTLGALSANMRYLFAGLFFAYGIFRIIWGVNTIRKASRTSTAPRVTLGAQPSTAQPSGSEATGAPKG